MNRDSAASLDAREPEASAGSRRRSARTNRRRGFVALGFLGLLFFVFLNNANLVNSRPPGRPLLLAHRGIAQRFEETGLTADTCTAARMLPPVHDYLENTIDSMQAAIDAGADIIEIDVQPTTDGQFAVFHGWTLDCRTNGSGVTREHTMDELQALDIGHGYTADGGCSHPFRGAGVGLMPSLDEVLKAFPDQRFLINIKSSDADEGVRLARFLAERTAQQRSRIMVYGGSDAPLAALEARLPEVVTFSRTTLASCLGRYLAIGWTGIVPVECQNTVVLVPVNVAPLLWGWPDRLLNRMDAPGTTVFVAGPSHGGDFSSGLNTVEAFHRLPMGYSGGIWTDEIELMGQLTRPRVGTAR